MNLIYSFLILIAALKPIPRVLFLTSSLDGKGTLPKGAHLALEEFSRHGAFVTFHDASILYEPEKLKNYEILIIPTAYGYHDIDRTLSLTYLDTIAMKNILEWVKAGGLLIAGGNVGRNTLNGKDRLLSGNILDRNEWPLGRAFGFDMVEVSLQGFSLVNTWKDPPLLEWFNDTIFGPVEAEEWILMPKNEEKDVIHLAEWRKGNIRYGGVTLRKYGKGYAVYLSSFLLLHPSFDGGWADVPQITRFYHRAFMFYLGLKNYSAGVNPWPAGCEAAFSVTLDDGGVMEEYKRTLNEFLSRVPKITFFVTGRLNPEILDFLRRNRNVELGNHSYSHPFFRTLNYLDSKREILMAQNVIGKTAGFRFPFVNYTASGIYALWELGFSYESSIKVDHLSDFKGALFPYNLVVALDGNTIVTTDLLEISPVEEDWAFYKRLLEEKYPLNEQKKDQEAFYSYLNTMWSIIRDAHGLMVQMGHPMYEGHTEEFLRPVLEFIDSVKAERNVWIASLNDIAKWWRRIRNVRVSVEEKRNSLNFEIYNPYDQIDRFTLWIDVEGPVGPPKLKFKNTDGYYFIRQTDYGRRIYILLNLKTGNSRVEVEFP